MITVDEVRGSSFVGFNSMSMYLMRSSIVKCCKASATIAGAKELNKLNCTLQAPENMKTQSIIRSDYTPSSESVMSRTKK